MENTKRKKIKKENGKYKTKYKRKWDIENGISKTENGKQKRRSPDRGDFRDENERGDQAGNKTI